MSTIERMPGIISIGCYGVVSHPGGSAGERGGCVLMGWGPLNYQLPPYYRNQA